MRKTDLSVDELVKMIERGELKLPEMQRRYVWRGPRVRDLLDSLYRGYPSGAILVWETDQPMPTQEMAVAQGENPFTGHKLLLDGQQRLTSLSAVIRGEPIKVRGRKRPIDILFNLDHPDELAETVEVEGDEETPLDEDDFAEGQNGDIDEEEGDDETLQERFKKMTFVVAAKNLEALPNWVPVTKVFKSDDDAQFLTRAGVASFNDPRFKKYSHRLGALRGIRKYMYSMQILERELSYEEVAEIFVRVNSLGVKLRGSDLALALITSRWQKSLKLLEEFQTECEEKWFTLDIGLLVKTMVAFATGQSKFRTVGSVPVDKLKTSWEEAKDGLRFAVNFLRANADIEDESLLSSPFVMIPIAYYSHHKRGRLTKDEERGLLYWLLVANMFGRYSRGSSETFLDMDISAIIKDGGPEVLVENLRRQAGRLNVGPEDFEGKGARSPLFSTLFLALKKKQAKDWYTGLGLSLSHQGRFHYIQYHHIFPKALLKGDYEKKEINEIANMAFISGGTNRKLGKKEPFDYFPGIIKDRGEEALTSQLVPTDSRLWKLENYREFLKARREVLAKTVNEFLDGVRP